MEIADGEWRNAAKLLDFAETLYKCKLCQSLPYILTSAKHFVSHMYEAHLSLGDSLRNCSHCPLKFGTSLDLRTHMEVSHPPTKQADRKLVTMPSQCETDDLCNESQADDSALGTSMDKDGIRLNISTGGELVIDESIPPVPSPSRIVCVGEKSTCEDVVKEEVLLTTDNDVFNRFSCEICGEKEMSLDVESHCRSKSHLRTLDKLRQSCEKPAVKDGPNASSSCSVSEKFGKYASSFEIHGQRIYLCQACGFRSPDVGSSHLHFQSQSHMTTVSQMEKQVGKNIKSIIKKHSSNASPANESVDQGSVSDSGTGGSPDSGRNKRKRAAPVHVVVQDELCSSADSDIEDIVEDFTENIAVDDLIPVKRISIMNANKKLLVEKPGLNKHQVLPNNPNVNEKTTSASLKSLERFVGEITSYANVESQSADPNTVLTVHTPTDQEHSKAAASYSGATIHHYALGPSAVDNKYKLLSPGSLSWDFELAHGPDLDSAHCSPTKPRSGMAEHKCSHCDYQYATYEDYYKHCVESHGTTDSLDINNEQSGNIHGEAYKIHALQQFLRENLVYNKHGIVPREELLDMFSEQSCNPDIHQWGSACNKAVRDLFPDSVAQRKGKFKKTYFFGVSLLNAPSTMAEEDFEEEEQVLALTPLKDMGRSTENLLATLPEIVAWTGDPEQCIMREGLLEVVAGVLDDQVVLEWGIPCNRAMRHLFPSLTIKRRGKYKTTCFYGVEFADCYKHRTEDCLWYRGWSGPPVNVMDVVDSPEPFNMNKLSPYQTNHKTNSVLTKHNNKNIPPTENISVVMQDASPVLVSGNAPILTVKEECVVNTSEDVHVTEEPMPTVNIKCSTPVKTNNKHAPKVSVLENQVKIENVAIEPTTVVIKSTPNVNPSVHKTNSTGKLEDKNHVSSHINKLVELARQISPIVQKMDRKPANQEQSDAVIAMEHAIVDTDTATSVSNSNSSSKDFWVRMERQIRNNLKSTDTKSESSVITEAEHSDTSVGSSSNESAGAYPRTNHQNVNVTQHLTPQETVDMMKLLSQEKTSILNQTATRTRRISQPSKYSAYQLDAITPGPGEQKRPREKVHKEPKAVPTELGRLDELERLILLHPGPFITARIIHRRLQRLIPHVERGIQAMTSLQDRGLGQVYTLKQGSSRVFYKAIPHSDIEAALSDLSIKMEEYRSVFAERDPKLEESLHTKVKVHYPYLDQLPEFYNY